MNLVCIPPALIVGAAIGRCDGLMSVASAAAALLGGLTNSGTRDAVGS